VANAPWRCMCELSAAESEASGMGMWSCSVGDCRFVGPGDDQRDGLVPALRFTSTEARLANLLMEGKTLDECCAGLGIRHSTGCSISNVSLRRPESTDRPNSFPCCSRGGLLRLE